MTSEPTAKPNLGRLEKIDLAAYWKTEASDFIPWLIQQENLKLLTDTIGIDLEVVLDTAPREVLPSDLLCRDVRTGGWVIIGNQLNPSDEDHLGHLLTHAANINASAVIWISSQFAPEHRTVLDWLNRMTQSSIQFFGLELELWRIGEAAMAARFNEVTQAKKQLQTALPDPAASTESEAAQPLPPPPEEQLEETPEPLSQVQQQNLDVWTALCNQLDQRGSIVKPGAPVTETHISFAIGRAGFRLYANLDREASCFDVGLSCSDVDAHAYFHLLFEQQDAIEAEMGILMDWSNDADGQTFAVYCTLTEIDLDDPVHWVTYTGWMCDFLEKLHSTFSRRIKALRAGDFRPIPYSLTELQNALTLPN
jgi:Domain of unknown function (DUF4268)